MNITRVTSRLLTGLFTLICASAARAQDGWVQPETLPQGFVIVVNDTTRMASDAKPMFLAGNVNGWDPAKPDYRLSPRSDGKWQYVFERFEHDGTLQFKLTLGSWDSVETDPDGADIENRTLPKVQAASYADGSRPVIELMVPRFRSAADVANERQSTDYRDLNVTGTLRRLQVAGGAGPASGLMRDLLIWLPPDYDAPQNADRRYPVLYLFDGQNLFDRAPAGPAEWGVDETAQSLVQTGAIEPIIIVGVPHSGTHRISEYLPFDIGRDAHPHGKDFAAWFINEVQPRVERAVRVSNDRSTHGIGGSSLGAVIAAYLALQNPGSFGRLYLESMTPVQQHSQEARTLLSRSQAWPKRVWIGVGDAEMGSSPAASEGNDRMVQAAKSLYTALAAPAPQGQHPVKVELMIGPGHEHNEASWAKRVQGALLHLYSTP